jgi:8-oxo-dGTP pyrophosphatase MutT (NUDIX family)
LADYDFKMDDALKDELKPTEPFIRYARQRLNNEADIAMQGERRPYVQAFGKPFADLRTDKTTGEVRRRLRPNQQLIKAAPRLKAAGLMLMHGPSDSPKILLLKRASGGDHQGEWCFPGGKIEPGETPRQAAIRETREEIGPVAHGRPQMWARRIAGGVDFTTFAARVPTAYEPVLNDEHSDWKWASPDDLPSPMHPGCAVAIDKLAHRSKGMVLGKASPFGGFRQAVRNGMARQRPLPAVFSKG